MAMGTSSLFAVSPDWLRARNGEVKCRERCRTIRYGHEVRIEASDTIRIQWAARRSKGRLSDRVVLLMEFKCNNVTWLGGNVRGGEDQ